MYQKLESKIQQGIFDNLSTFDYIPRTTKLKDFSSRWRVTSAMQKAIRRGHVDIAQKMGAALNTSVYNYFWSRIATIALEDVLFGNKPATLEALYLSSNPELRKEIGEAKAAAYLTWRLAVGGKDRSACDAVVGIGGSLNYQDERDVMHELRVPDLIAVMLDKDAPFHERVIAGRYLIGTKTTTNYKDRKGSNDNILTAYKRMYEAGGIPLDVLYMIDMGLRKKAELMPVTIGLVYQCFYPKKLEYDIEAVDNFKMFGGIPSYAHDTHTAEGKKAVEYFGRSCKPVASYVKEHSLDPAAAVRCMFFRADTDVLNKRLLLKDGGFIRHTAGYGLGLGADRERAGPPAPGR